MSNEIPALEARYTANIIQFDRELKRMQTLNARAANKILTDHQGAARKVNSTWAKADLGSAIRKSVGGGLNGLKSDLAGLSGALAAGLSVSAAVGLADTFTRFQSSLKVAGLEGQNLATVQDHLFAAANRNGIAVEGLGQLYGRVAQSAKDLGASQGQLLTMSDAVTAAIRVNGGTMESASGAMLQLSQALGSPIVRAEEFNSMMEGMRPLLQAAAEASAKYAGSVSAMRNDVLKGKLTSQEFFNLILAGSASLEAKAAKAPLTVGQSFETLKNKMIEAMGATNATWGITARLTEALTWLSENLDTVAGALGVVALVLASTMAPAIGLATKELVMMTAAGVANGVRMISQVPAMLAFSASMQGISVSAAAARTGLNLLMSSTGVGLAVVALTAAIGFFAVKNYKAAEATRQLRSELDGAYTALQAKKKAAQEARQATGDFTADELKAITATANLTGRVDLLATAYGKMALQAWEAARASAAAALADANHKRRIVQVDREQTESRATRQARGPGYYGGADGRQPAPRGLDQVVQGTVQTDPAVVAARTAEQQAIAIQAQAKADYDKVIADARRAGGVESYRPVTTTSPAGSGKGSKGSGPSDADRAKNAANETAQAERALADATRALAITVEDRHAAALASLDDDRKEASREIAQRVTDREIDAATATELNLTEDKITAAKKQLENTRYQEEVAARTRYLAGLDNQNAQDRINLEADAADYLARTSTTLQERQAHEREALAARQRADDLAFSASQESLRLELVKQGVIQSEIDTRLAANQAIHDARKAQDSGQLSSDQATERGPASISAWTTEFARATAQGKTFNQQLMGIAEGGINDLSDGITDAIMGAKSFGEAISDMAKSVIASLIKMAVQFVIFEALGRAFGVPGLGRVAIGLYQPSVGHNAAGTNNWRGGLTSVNEAGGEILNLPSGTQIIPHDLSKRALSAPTGTGSSTPIVINTTVQANDAVLTGTVKTWIAQANVDALTMAAKVQAKDQQRRGRQRF